MFKNICWINWLFIIMVAGLSIYSISTLLAGCGNKGALYLPSSDSSTHNKQPVPVKTK